MEVEFSNGYALTLTTLPGRKRPVLVLNKDGRYLTHAVIKDMDGYHQFKRFFQSLWGRS